jgi:hypothetical protein
MIAKVIDALKSNWLFFAVAIVVVLALVFFGKEKSHVRETPSRAGCSFDYEVAGCSTCSSGDAGVLLDTELTGCSTCFTGDAGVLLDTETEMYGMPDDYYHTPEEIADTIAEVSHNPDEFEAVTEDREDEMVVIDPTDYAKQSDDRLVADFYGDEEMEYQVNEQVRKIRFMPLDMDLAPGSFTLL